MVVHTKIYFASVLRSKAAGESLFLAIIVHEPGIWIHVVGVCTLKIALSRVSVSRKFILLLRVAVNYLEKIELVTVEKVAGVVRLMKSIRFRGR